ncbi:hypothetical protein EJ08DRAFT_168983 [Tothia fuscella]|uniref:Uncharacterized protein n=1 Tax=Tothia fuscella TaxID=1048955 RepID=A0A9P4U0G2_9PEZI|nr:hypothetical protein EJ08DRAFT_168983 [Tothia fuscella]
MTAQDMPYAAAYGIGHDPIVEESSANVADDSADLQDLAYAATEAADIGTTIVENPANMASEFSNAQELADAAAQRRETTATEDAEMAEAPEIAAPKRSERLNTVSTAVASSPKKQQKKKAAPPAKQSSAGVTPWRSSKVPFRSIYDEEPEWSIQHVLDSRDGKAVPHMGEYIPKADQHVVNRPLHDPKMLRTMEENSRLRRLKNDLASQLSLVEKRDKTTPVAPDEQYPFSDIANEYGQEEEERAEYEAAKRRKTIKPVTEAELGLYFPKKAKKPATGQDGTEPGKRNGPVVKKTPAAKNNAPGNDDASPEDEPATGKKKPKQLIVVLHVRFPPKDATRPKGATTNPGESPTTSEETTTDPKDSPTFKIPAIPKKGAPRRKSSSKPSSSTPKSNKKRTASNLVDSDDPDEEEDSAGEAPATKRAKTSPKKGTGKASKKDPAKAKPAGNPNPTRQPKESPAGSHSAKAADDLLNSLLDKVAGLGDLGLSNLPSGDAGDAASTAHDPDNWPDGDAGGAAAST